MAGENVEVPKLELLIKFRQQPALKLSEAQSKTNKSRKGGASDDASVTRSSSPTRGDGGPVGEDDRDRSGQHASDLNGSGLNDRRRVRTFPGEDCS
jgi:hypothetical protein